MSVLLAIHAAKSYISYNTQSTSQPKKELMNELQIFATVLLGICGGVEAVIAHIASGTVTYNRL